MKNITTLISSFLLLIISNHIYAYDDPIYTSFFSDKALSGYDTVAYFKQGKAVKGLKKYKTEYKGATWYFSSQENLQTFTKAPENYAPQYGGYCAYAAADNRTAGGDPELWSIYNGKLYLSYDEDIVEKWEKDKQGIVSRADKNWPALLD